MATGMGQGYGCSPLAGRLFICITETLGLHVVSKDMLDTQEIKLKVADKLMERRAVVSLTQKKKAVFLFVRERAMMKVKKGGCSYQ